MTDDIFAVRFKFSTYKEYSTEGVAHYLGHISNFNYNFFKLRSEEAYLDYLHQNAGTRWTKSAIKFFKEAVYAKEFRLNLAIKWRYHLDRKNKKVTSDLLSKTGSVFYWDDKLIVIMSPKEEDNLGWGFRPRGFVVEPVDKLNLDAILVIKRLNQ